MSGAFRRGLLGCVVVVAVLAQPAFAAPDLERAYAALEKAYAHFDRGEYRAAIEAFERAYAASSEPRFLLNIAVSHGKLEGACGVALAAFDRFLDACPDCPQRASGLDERAAQVRACEAAVTLDSRPRGAQVLVDGAPRGRTPARLTLAPGEYGVSVRLTGHVPVDERMVLRGGQSTHMLAMLRPTPPTTGTLQVRGAPSGTVVRLDGKALDEGALSVPAGTLALSVELPDAEPKTVQVQVREGGVTELDLGAAPPVRRRLLRPWVWTALAVGVAGVGTGAMFTVQLDDDLRAEREAVGRAAVEAAREDANRDAVLAQVGYGVGAMGLAAALTLWLLDDTSDAAALVEVGAGGVRGRF